MDQNKEVTLTGISISKGIAIGSPFFLHSQEDPVPSYLLKPDEVEEEIHLYKKALHQSEEEIQSLQLKCTGDGQREVVAILDSHLQILQDPLITTEIEKKIRQKRENSALVFTKAIGDLKDRLIRSNDYFFQERARDVSDIGRRVLSHLLPQKPKIAQFPENILITSELIPSLAAEAHPRFTVGFITQLGGISSHAAIIARAKRVPYVAGINLKEFEKQEVNQIVIDGNKGKVVLNPSAKTLKSYRKLQVEDEAFFAALEKESHLDAETFDGYNIKIMGNVDSWEDLPLLPKHGAAGIGLFRCEYLLFSQKKKMEEEDQIIAYQKLVGAVEPSQPVVIRMYDLGGDKPFLPIHKEEPNPVLGFRAIRLLKQEKPLFKKQIRALLRANTVGNIHLLLPMVSDVEEIKEVKLLIEEAKKELVKEKLFYKDLLVGCMIEVPSIALLADAICKEVDFISVGTNDLVQLTLAVDRTNPYVSHLYDPIHPSILRLIRMIVVSSAEHKKPLFLCGEMSGDPFYVPLLLGLGVKKISMSLRSIPVVKHALRKLQIIECSKLADKAMQLSSAMEVRSFLQARYKEWGFTF